MWRHSYAICPSEAIHTRLLSTPGHKCGNVFGDTPLTLRERTGGVPAWRAHEPDRTRHHSPGRCPRLMNGRPVGAHHRRGFESFGLSPERAASHEPRATPWATEQARVHGHRSRLLVAASRRAPGRGLCAKPGVFVLQLLRRTPRLDGLDLAPLYGKTRHRMRATSN